MKPKAVLFDLDGTLMSLDCLVPIFNATCRKHGVKEMTKNEFITKVVGHTAEEAMQNLYHMTPEKAIEFKQDFIKEYVKQEQKECKLFPNSIKIIKELQKKGIKIGIVTTKSRKTLKKPWKPSKYPTTSS